MRRNVILPLQLFKWHQVLAAASTGAAAASAPPPKDKTNKIKQKMPAPK